MLARMSLRLRLGLTATLSYLNQQPRLTDTVERKYGQSHVSINSRDSLGGGGGQPACTRSSVLHEEARAFRGLLGVMGTPFCVSALLALEVCEQHRIEEVLSWFPRVIVDRVPLPSH